MGSSTYWKRIWNLQKKYTNPLTDIPLGCLSELNCPHPPEEKLDNSPLKLGEIKDFVKKSRAKSSPGINSISYKLYKNCLKYKHFFGSFHKKPIERNSLQRVGD